MDGKRKGINKKTVKRYSQSEKGKLTRRKYWQSEEGKQCNRKYRQTIKGCLHAVYANLKQRCNNPKTRNYKNYGGRGIKNKFKSVNEFIDYIINVLQIDPRRLQIDRIDNDGHYEKGNIRFITAKENANNRRDNIK